MMQASVYGRVGQDPRAIRTQSGKSMAVASMAISIGDHDAQPLWIQALAFGHIADTLLRHEKGDLISVAGRVQRNDWTTTTGEKREQLQIVAESIVSSRSVRPGGGKRKPEKEPATRPSDQPDFNDDLPF